MKVVCIGAHPDDVELGMGGTIAFHVKNGDNVSIILCTLGGVSGNPKLREKEAKNSAKILGVNNLIILDYPVSKLNNPQVEFTKILRGFLNKIRPNRV